MKTNTLLGFVIFFIILVSIVFSFLIYTKLNSYRVALNNYNSATTITYEIFSRRLVGDEYLQSPGQRTKSQWFLKQDQLKKVFSSSENNFTSAKEKQLLSDIETHIGESEKIFTQLVAVTENKDVSTDSAELTKNSLAAQLTLKAQETITEARNLAQINRDHTNQLLQEIILLFSVVASLFFVMLIVSFGVIARSVSQLDKSHAILAAKEAELQLAQKIAQVGSWSLELPNHKLSLSPEMYTIFGLPSQDEAPTVEEFIARIYVEDQLKIKKLLTEITASPKPMEVEYRAEVNNDIRWYKAIASVSKDEDGQPIQIVGTARDITEERRLEQLKDEFVSVASHELRTPMTAIKGTVSMMLEGDYGKLNPELVEPLQDISSSTQRLIGLVNDMLNVSRIEAGRLKIDLVKFELPSAITEMVNTLQSIAKSKKITLTAEKVDSVEVQADPDKVKQILNNLIGNALKFTDNGSIKISTQIDRELVKIFVSDTGMGIDKANQAKLFGKFQQITSQQAGKPAGTGLGLFISRQLARKMGGDLWIEKSELNVGSTFAFSVPLAGTYLAKKVTAEIDQEAKAHPDQKRD